MMLPSSLQSLLPCFCLEQPGASAGSLCWRFAALSWEERLLGKARKHGGVPCLHGVTHCDSLGVLRYLLECLQGQQVGPRGALVEQPELI